MIHDAIVPVTCDKRFCLNEQYVDRGGIEFMIKQLKERGWIIIDKKYATWHYCSEVCAREAEDGKS